MLRWNNYLTTYNRHYHYTKILFDLFVPLRTNMPDFSCAFIEKKAPTTVVDRVLIVELIDYQSDNNEQENS